MSANYTDADAQRRDEITHDVRRKQWLSDIKAVMGTVEGRRFVWGLLETGSPFSDRFYGNSRDIYEKGKRFMALKVYNDVLEADMLGHFIMQTENIKDEEAEPELRRFLTLVNRFKETDNG